MTDRDRNVIVTLEDGSELGLRVDNWVLKETQKKAGCKGIIELLQRIGIDDANIDNETFIILVMEAVNEYHHFKGEKTVIDQRTASRYIDDMGGIIMALQKISEGLAQYIPKNHQPPVKTGEMTLQ
jgi:hypothetical protein